MAELDDLDLNFNEAAQTLGETNDDRNVVDLEDAARNLNKSQAETVLDAVETEEVNPDTVRDQRSTAQELNTPVEIIELDFDEAAKELKRRRRNDTLQDHPGTQDFLSNPPNAKIASDDVAGLSRIEDLHKKSFSEKTDIIFNDSISRYLRAPIADFLGFGGAALEGVETVGDAIAGLIGLPEGDKDDAGISAAMSTPRALVLQGLLKVLQETGADVPATPTDAVLEGTTALGETLQKASDAINIADRSFGEDVAGAVGQLTAQVGAGLISPVLGLGTLVTAGATETENIIEEIKKEGKEPRFGETGERLTILGGALVTAVAEKIGLDLLLKRAPPGLKNRAARYVADKLIAGGIEATEEGVEAALRDFIIKVGVDEERAILEDFTAREAGVAGTAGAVFRTLLGVRYAKSNQEKSAEMLDTVRDDILRQRSPEAFDQFFQSLADREDNPDVRLAAEPMVEYLVGQGENPVEFFQELGVDEKSMTVAYESGGDIKVPAGSFFTKMADSPYRDEALVNIREGDGAPTVAEMELQSQETQERLTKVLEEMDSEDQQEITGSIDRVRERFKQDAIVAGRTRQEADSAAAVWDSTFRTALDAYANDPNRTRPLQEIARDLEENVFNVRTRKIPFAERGEAQETFQETDTTSENFRQFFEGSQVVDQNGEPLVVFHGTTAAPFNIFDMSQGEIARQLEGEGAMYFTDSKDHAEFFADYTRQGGGTVMPVYLSMKNPMEISQTDLEQAMEDFAAAELENRPEDFEGMSLDDVVDGLDERPIDFVADFVAGAKDNGYDGVIIRDFADLDQTSDVFLPFSSNQIKSVDNRGTFDTSDANILFQDGQRFQDTHSNDERVERDKNKHGLMPYIRDYSDTEPTREGKPIVIKTNNKNAAAELEKIDEVLNANPDAHTSVDAWKKMMADAYVTQDVPIPPYRFIQEINSNNIVRNLSRLTPGQIEDADEGFQNARDFRQAYTSGQLGVETTGKMFMWSFLSRGVSPYAQESLFIDAFPEADVWIAAAAQPGFDVDRTAIDIDLGSGPELQAREQLVTRANLQSWNETNKKRKKAGKRALPKPNDFGFRRNDDGTVNTTYSEWVKSVSPKGSGRPGAGATHNLNAFGKDFLTKMSTDVGDGTGRSKLQYIHDLMEDPNSTGKMIRREFAKIGEGVGIDNKVVSFTLLVAGFDDVMVLDRVQFRQLYNDGRFDGINIYDGYKEAGKTGAVTGSGLAKQGDGTRGILIYEAFERAIEARIKDIYAELGREGVGSVGRYHWETWVADSGQEASHGSIGAILPDALGDRDAINNVTAKQGEYGSYAYGARYGVDGNGISYFQYGTPSGKIFTFTVPQFVEFLDQVKLPKNGVVPKNYKVTETENAPWYTSEEVDSKALDKLAQTLSAGAAGKRAGTVRQANKDTSLSERFAATDTELFQTETVDPPTGIGRLYSQAQRATQSLKQQKATASQWLSHFKKNGVKDDELDFVVGLKEFLNSQKTIDKDDLFAFIQQNGIKLDEVKLGGPEPEKPASLEAAEENEAQRRRVNNRAYNRLYDALKNIFLAADKPPADIFGRASPIMRRVARNGPSAVQEFKDESPGILEMAQEHFEAVGELRLAMEKTNEENKKWRGSFNLSPKFSGYTERGDRISPDREFYLTLPADLTEGNAAIEDWLVPQPHRIDVGGADSRLVVRIRANGRELDDGQRVLFLEEMQDDRGQEARDKGVRQFVPNLEARKAAYTEAESLARGVMAKAFPAEPPKDNLLMYSKSRYLDAILDMAARIEAGGERWVTSQNRGSDLFLTGVELVNTDVGLDTDQSSRDFEFSPEDIEVVDRLIELKRSEIEEVTGPYQSLSSEKGVPDRPFIATNKVVPLALKRMMIEATEEGFDSIAWTSGEMQTERYSLARVVSSIEVLDINDDEAFVIVNQGTFGPIALEGVITDDMLREDQYGQYEQPIVNIVPREKLASYFGKDLAAKMVEGGRMQTYRDLDLDIGGTGMRKFYNEIAVNAANKIGKKYKAKTEVGQLNEKDVWVFPITDSLENTILGEGLPMMQAAKKDDPMGSFDPVRRVINLFEKSDYSTVLHESGHAFVNILENLAERDDAPQRIRDNYQAMLEWVGAESSADMDLRINGEKAREKQERLARAFEAYLMEGKAPSNALRSAFNQFKNWLSKIYNNLRQLDVTMDDEIRQVFDRMLATDAEIDDLIAVNEFTAEASPSIFAMMDMEEREKAASLQIAARDRARAAAALERQKHDALIRGEKFKEETDIVRDEVTDQVYAERKYGAFYYLTRGEYYGDRETPDALRGKRLSRSKLLDYGFTKEELQALPRANGKSGKALYSSSEEDAHDPAAMAASLGYDTGEELVADMRTIVYPEDEIERRTTEIMANRPEYADPAEDGTLRSISEAALFNAEQAERLELQLDALAREAGQEKQSRAFLKAVADRMFAEEPIGDLLSQYKFAGASRRAARAAERAAARKDFQKAFVEKRKEILNFELHRRAVKAKEEVAKARTELNKLKRQKIDPKRVAADYVGNVKALLNFYEFGAQNKTGQIDTAAAQNIVNFIQKQQDSGASIILPGDLITVIGKDERSGDPILAFRQKFWKTMTLAELRALRDLTKNLMKQGRDASQTAKEAKIQFGLDLAAGILNSTKRRRERPEDRVDMPRKDMVKKAFRFATFAEHRKLESMLRQLDGFEANGPMWSAVFDKLAEASDNKAVMISMLLKQQDEMADLLTEEQRKSFSTGEGAVPIQALGGFHLRLETRMVIALNWGNESSREAVLEDQFRKQQFGELWNEEAIEEILSTLDDNALNYIEATWKLIDSFWEDVTLPNGRTVSGVKSLEERTTGIAPPKVEPLSFEVNGRIMTGAYYPLVYDSLKDTRARAETEDTMKRLTEVGGFARAQTTHGHTIGRVGSGGRPVRVDLAVVNKHLDQVTQDLAYREAIQEAADVLLNKDVQNAIEATMGRPFYDNMKEILVRTATGQVATTELGPFNKIMMNSRINFTTAIMGFNLRSILTQPLGVSQSFAEIGVRETGAGYSWFFKTEGKSYKEQIAYIHSLSVYMGERARTMTRELDDIANSLQRDNKFDDIRAKGFAPMTYVDMLTVAYPTWYGAYNKAMMGRVDGINESDQVEAIKYADQVVRITQSAGGALNLSMVQQRSETMKLMTLLYSYFNSTYQLQAEAWAKARQDGSSIPRALLKSDFIAQTMMLQIYPALIGSLILDAWPSDEDEEEDGYLFAWTKWTLKSIVSYTSGQFVFIRDFAGLAINPHFGIDLTPMESVAKDLVRIPSKIGQVYSDPTVNNSSELAKKMVQVGGQIAGVPGSSTMARTADYLTKWTYGELKTPPDSVAEGVWKSIMQGDR